jgi:hypothetical protein
VEPRAAARVVLSRLPGFESAAAGTEHDAPDLVFGEAFVVFPGARGDHASAAALLQAVRDAEAEVLHDVQVDALGRGATLDADPRLALPVSAAWSGGAHHRHDRALCAC